MKQLKLLPFFILGLFFVSALPVKGMSRPAYALTETDRFIVENDYALFMEQNYSSGTIESYYQIWLKPSSSIPLDPNNPPTGIFSVEYNEDSDKEFYDSSYYDSIRTYLAVIDAGLEDITEDVPGAGLAILYSLTPGAYIAVAYFGEKTGIFVSVAEVNFESLQPRSSDYSIKSNYDKNGLKEIIVNIGEKVSKVLHLPSFGALLTIATLTTIATLPLIIRKYRLNQRN